MKFTTQASAIADALNRSKSILELSATSDAAASYYFVYSSSFIEVGGECQSASIAISLECDNRTQEQGAFCVNRDDLLGLIKGRKEVTVELDGSLLKITSGKYKVSIATKAASKEQLSLLSFDTRKGTALTEEALETLKQGIEMTALTDVYFGNPLNNYIRVHENHLTVCCYSSCHFAQFRTEAQMPDMQVAIPTQYFNSLWKFTKGGLKIDMSGSAFIAYGDGFRIRLPSAQATDENFQLVDLILQDIRPQYTTKIVAEDLQGLTQNLFTLFEPNSGFHFRSASGAISVEIKSGKGTASEEIRAGKNSKGELDCMVDPRLLREIIACKSTKTMSLQVARRKALVVKFGSEETFQVIAGTQLM